MGSRLAALLSTGRPPRRPARLAVLASMLVHAGLAVLLLHRQAREPAATPVAVEVDFTVADAPAEATSTPADQLSARANPLPSVTEGQRSKTPRSGDARTRLSYPSASAGTIEGHGVTAPAGGQEDPAGQAQDGFATFRPNGPDFSRVPVPQAPAARRDLLAAPRVPDKPPGELPRNLRGTSGVTAQVEEDGQIHFQSPKSAAFDKHPFASGEKRFLGLGGPLELNDLAVRLAGQDPYAPSKRKLAEETREQRLCMARRAQHARQAQALLELSTNVRAIAGRKDWSPEERRRALFDIWDECDDGDSDYATMARATIAAIIRQAFPEGSPLAYQAQELLALNSRRTSSDKFAPYRMQETHRRTPPSEDCRPPDAGRPLE